MKQKSNQSKKQYDRKKSGVDKIKIKTAISFIIAISFAFVVIAMLSMNGLSASASEPAEQNKYEKALLQASNEVKQAGDELNAKIEKEKEEKQAAEKAKQEQEEKEAELKAKEKAEQQKTSDTSKSEPASNNKPTGETTASSEKTSDQPGTITINGRVISYIKSSTTPSTQAGVWKGSASTTDGSYCYFVGHNPGCFSGVLNLGNGSKVRVCDNNGNSRNYIVCDVFDVSRNTTWEQVKNRCTKYGECIAMQTCITGGGYRIVVAR